MDFLAFAKNMGKNIEKFVSKRLSGKYSQKRFDHAKQSPTNALKTTSKKLMKIKQKQLVI